jgi:hypothetical protein
MSELLHPHPERDTAASHFGKTWKRHADRLEKSSIGTVMKIMNKDRSWNDVETSRPFDATTIPKGNSLSKNGVANIDDGRSFIRSKSIVPLGKHAGRLSFDDARLPSADVQVFTAISGDNALFSPKKIAVQLRTISVGANRSP